MKNTGVFSVTSFSFSNTRIVATLLSRDFSGISQCTSVAHPVYFDVSNITLLDQSLRLWWSTS